LPFISSAIEAGAGAINAVNIDNDQTLTEEQKQRKQAQNAGATAGAIGGGLGGAAVGAMVGSVVPVVGTIIGGIVGAWLGTTGGRIVGDKIGGWVDDLRKADIAGRISNAWTGFIEKITPSFSGLKESILDLVRPKANKPIDILKNAPTKSMSLGEKPVPIVGDVYANKESELYKNYQKWREADTDGKGVITLDDFKKSKIVKNNPNLLKQFEPVSAPKKQDAKGFNKDKAKSIQSVANRLGINPNDLAQIISFETGGTFDPAQKNLAGGSARGLIQFMPSTAKGLGTTTEALAAMTFDEQMVYVEKYLKKRGIGKNGKTSLPDIYDAVLGSGYKKGSKEYAANKGVDADKNGVISKGEAVNSKAFAPHRQKQFFAQIATVTPKAITTPTSKVTTNSVPTMKSAPVNAASSPSVQSVPSVQAQESPRRLDNTPTPIKVSMPKPLVGQNISDRGIAHIVTGGIGETV